MSLLALICCILIGTNAAQLQGVLIKNKEIGPDYALRYFGGDFPHTSLETAAGACAQIAAERNFLMFGLKHTDTAWTPRTPYEHRQPPRPQQAYRCWISNPNYNGAHYLYDTEQTSVCPQDQNCTSAQQFRDLPPGVTRTGHFFNTLHSKGASNFEECKTLVANYELNNPSNESFSIEAFITFERNGIDTVCSSYRRWGTIGYRKEESHIGILQPQFLIGTNQKIPHNIYSLSSTVGPTDVSCSQKDIPSEFARSCQTFTYNLPANKVAALNNLKPSDEQLQLPDSHRTSYISSIHGQIALTYRKIVQVSDHIAAASGSIALPAYTAQDALEQCSQQALRAMHHTFNVYLTRKGWNCQHIFKFTRDPNYLEKLDEMVLQSYMYTANYTSQNDLEA